MSNQAKVERKPVIIGGGPSGLTAAYQLAKYGLPSVVLEKQDKVGGLARTEQYKGFHFDMGGHRFFTKSAECQNMWQEVLGDDFLTRSRLSRIYYERKFFYYPLRPVNALLSLGILRGIRMLLSYVRWHLFPFREEETFEQWVTNRFGRELFQTFFKSYTEKVWGISTSELKAEWAAQRIKDLSLRTVVTRMFFKGKNTIKSLIEQFQYPRLGPGMLWGKVRDHVVAGGGRVQLDSKVVRVHREGQHIRAVVVERDGREECIEGTDFISSMPLSEFVKVLEPAPPPSVLEAANRLSYRDFLTVCLILDREELFPDNWIYVHDPEVDVGRIQNFKNWSPEMVPDSSKSSLGLEYFCNEGDALWSMDDDALIKKGIEELDRIGLIDAEDVVDGTVFRVDHSYPVYDGSYREHLATLRKYVESLDNFQTIGRNGLHRYNNQDHAMLTGMMAARNIVFGESHDVWTVNVDDEYHEEINMADPRPVVAGREAEDSGAGPATERQTAGAYTRPVFSLEIE